MSMPRFYVELEKLIKEGINDEFKKLLQTVNPSDLAYNSGMTLLHFAAQLGDVELTKLLLEKRHDVNARDSFGATPILTALHHKNFKIVKVLLDNGVDILIADAKGLTLLDTLIRHKVSVPTEIFESVFSQLKNRKVGVESIVDILTESKCTLELVLLMREPEVARRMLAKKKFISHSQACTLVGLADFENLMVLLKYEPGVAYRRELFLRRVCEQLLDVNPQSKSVKSFQECVRKSDFPADQFVNVVRQITHNENQDTVRVLLEFGVYEFARRVLGRDLTADFFANGKVEAHKLLKNKKFKANAQNDEGYTALQLAVLHDAYVNVKFLLDVGVDPNAKGRAWWAETPLQMASMRCFMLLLQYGAEVDVNRINRLPIYSHSREFLKPVLARFVLTQPPGFKFDVLDESQWFPNCKEYCGTCDEQIKWTRTQKIGSSLTIFDVLTASVEYLAHHVRNKTTVMKILNVGREGKLDSYYLFAMEIKLSNALLMRKCRLKAAVLLAEVMELDRDHLVIERIVGYLKFSHALFLL